MVTYSLKKVGTSMKPVVFLGSVILCIALGIGAAYAVHQVGVLNREATAIESCVKVGSEVEQARDCPNPAASTAQAKSYRDEADTTGTLGWAAALFLIFGIGSTVYDNVKND